MPVSALLKSCAIVRASWSAQSSFCLWDEMISVWPLLLEEVDSGRSWSTKYFCPSFAKEQMETENKATPPPLIKSFNSAESVGERSQFARNCSADGPKPSTQIAASRGFSRSTTEPNALIAFWFARKITPPASTSNAGQPAFSSANTTSDFIAVTTSERKTSRHADKGSGQ